MASFASIYARAFVRPGLAVEALVAEPRRVRFGAYAVAIAALDYTLVYFFLAHNGGRPTVFHPWLAIDAEVYYRANQYLSAPSFFLGWVAASGFAQIAARALGGKGSFEDTLSVIGLGISVATWATGLHDLVTTFLGYVGMLDQRAYEDAMSTPGTGPHALIWALMLVYGAAFLVLFTKGIGAAHSLRTGRAAAAGTVGAAVFLGIFLLFNR